MENIGNPLGAFAKAVAFAADKHRNKRLKDAAASPYINHPIALANVLANEGGVEDVTVLCAAVLHDTIEDTETTSEELQAIFGPKVPSVVMEVTDDKSLEKSLRKQRQVEPAPHISTEVKLGKLADKIAICGTSLPHYQRTGRPNANKATLTGRRGWSPGCAACTRGGVCLRRFVRASCRARMSRAHASRLVDPLRRWAERRRSGLPPLELFNDHVRGKPEKSKACMTLTATTTPLQLSELPV